MKIYNTDGNLIKKAVQDRIEVDMYEFQGSSMTSVSLYRDNALIFEASLPTNKKFKEKFYATTVAPLFKCRALKSEYNPVNGTRYTRYTSTGTMLKKTPTEINASRLRKFFQIKREKKESGNVAFGVFAKLEKDTWVERVTGKAPYINLNHMAPFVKVMSQLANLSVNNQ